jgi:hypothetical protein
MTDHLNSLLGSSRPREIFLGFGWAILLISIPVSSFPLVAKFTGGSTVSPLAGLPLGLLLVFWFVPHLLRGGRLPAVSTPLMLFICVAVCASALAPFYEIGAFLGQTVFDRVVRALVTLVAGVGFYLVAATIPRSENGLRRSLRWVYLGAVPMLLWSSIQAYIVFRGMPVPDKLQDIHRLFSIRDMLSSRVTGLGYEPSWLADQLIVLYLPLWISSVIRGYSAFGRSSKFLSPELGLLIWGSAVLFLSQSRIGFLSASMSTGIVFLVGGWGLAGRWAELLGIRRQDHWKNKSRRWLRVLRIILWFLLLLVLLLIVSALIFVASRFDPRLARLFQTNYSMILNTSSQPLYAVANQLAYAERVIYWDYGLRVFAQYPLLGVGLGNAGFFFREQVPAFGYHLPEIIRILNGAAQFPNTKNLWIRLFAETGVVGFSVFIAWLFVIALGAWSLHKRGKGVCAVLGLAGLLALIAQVFEGFSLDSFALPQLWIMLGLMTAALSLTSDRGKSHKPINRNTG